MYAVILSVLVYLPLVGGWGGASTSPRFVPGVTRGGACVNALGGSGGQLCLLNGYYPAIESDNPSHIVFGGRQGDGSDAAWDGEEHDFDLISPALVIADADIVELAVPDYEEVAGPFVTAAPPYTAIVFQYDESDTVASGLLPQTPFGNEADFQQTLEKMLDEGQIFDVDWPGDVEFWDRQGLVSFRPSSCGVSHAVWVPEAGHVNILINRSPAWIITRGLFEPPALATCMGQFRWVHVTDLLTHPAAANLRDRVNQRRGGNVTTFSWFTDAQNQVYAFWSFAAGGIAYYGYQALNAPVLRPTMILIIPQEFYDVTCNTVLDVKTCLVQEGQPEN